MALEKRALASLVEDLDLYPRNSIDSQHVGYMVEALESGVELPPPVIDGKTGTIIDGVHRVRSHRRRLGPEAHIVCDTRVYRDRKEMFLEAMKLNANHGKNLTRCDRTRCAFLARKLRLKMEDVAKALNASLDRFLELVKDRTAMSKASNEPVPLKRTIRHMAGEKLTKKQCEVNTRLGGMQQMFYVNQVIGLIEGDLIDVKNESLLEKMRHLAKLLSDFGPLKVAV